jgi:hypothetical protein
MCPSGASYGASFYCQSCERYTDPDIPDHSSDSLCRKTLKTAWLSQNTPFVAPSFGWLLGSVNLVLPQRGMPSLPVIAEATDACFSGSELCVFAKHPTR